VRGSLIADVLLWASGLVGICRKWVKWLVLAIAGISFGTSDFWSIAETFWNEAAVLWFVFPLLDSIYNHAQGQPRPSNRAIYGSFGAAAAFFMVAVFCKQIEKFVVKRKPTTEGGP
jgi:hypothetical protein